jgi:spore germination cell wall hydrolase CwlJ-like protein
MSAEAADQGEEGMWLVGSVIENRRQKGGKAYHPEGDHTVQGTVLKPGQFSSVTNGSYLTCEIPPEAHEALARLERGEVAPQIIAFERIDSEVLDQYFDRAFEYKDHRFYTEKLLPKE